MARLNPPELPFHLVAVLQPSGDNALLQSGERLLDAVREAAANRLLFLPTRWGPAQDVGLLPTGHADALAFHLRTVLLPPPFQQFPLELLQLRTRCPHQVRPLAFPQRRQILFAPPPAIKPPYPPRSPVFALHRAQHRLQRGHLRSVAVEHLVAERESLLIHNQRDHHLLAIGPMIARVAPLH